jgi:hypothetical protein
MLVTEWQTEKEQVVREYQELRDAGQIDQEEYEELVQDILDYGALSEDLNNEEVKIRILAAVDAVKVLAGLL